MVHDVPKDTGVTPEIPKSPRTSRPKKDRQVAGPVYMSSRNPQFDKLSMEEKGKDITIEIDDEEEDIQAFIEEIELDEEMEEDI